MLQLRDEAKTLKILLVLLNSKALQDVLRYPFRYRDENRLPSEPFGLALDAFDGSH